MICEKTGKTCHTRKEANRLAGWWRRRRFAVMSHYRCKHCKSWHVGNRRP